jgi:phosphodiesterase/alkaline phosphatase D-like protein
MLGPEQEEWLGDALADSDARWNVIAQQTVVAHVPLAGQARRDRQPRPVGRLPRPPAGASSASCGPSATRW